ncbi:helix-hairpin-helix domain-containing protein [Ferruginibacter sp. HRS2-29]|uniref:helix-hairpin-helix domain-containing protein n=1 Tax=Ferruginibacter sp. HRS2-29 TaxID=2487334 RepID=UPI0020CF3745|nr:helix-hairpin-helix domain-containing protein [Ferruginibacter sp. HRS2-29]MCP9752722.1 helix-hairpin-helix domain-containing protein [Ferruginibacter sp. HRS2-29]
MKNLPDHYLHFTRKERNGIIVLLALVLLSILFPRIYFFIEKKGPLPVSESYAKEIAMLREISADSMGNHFGKENVDYSERYNNKASAPFDKEDLTRKLFSFDPNTLEISGWRSLGVKEKTAIGIRHYIEKGGRFKTAGDISKIWGLSDAIKQRLQPYINIVEKDSRPGLAYTKFPSQEKKPYEKKGVRPFDINRADTSLLIALPGIGSKLAARIINFRDRLGGFYMVSQVGETFGLPDSTFRKIRQYLFVSEAPLRMININTASLEELKHHPYIRWQFANVIVQYRLQHGNFTSVEELKKIMIIKEDIYLKISPYCKVE